MSEEIIGTTGIIGNFEYILEYINNELMIVLVGINGCTGTYFVSTKSDIIIEKGKEIFDIFDTYFKDRYVLKRIRRHPFFCLNFIHVGRSPLETFKIPVKRITFDELKKEFGKNN